MFNQAVRSSNLQRGAVFALMAVALTFPACVQDSGNHQVPGIKGPSVELIDNKFIMSVVFENLELDGGLTLPISPKMPNSAITFGPDLASEGMLLQVTISVVDVANLTNGAVVPFDPMTLPGGRPIPVIGAGYLPGVAISVPRWHDMAFYLSKANFGVFVPVNLPWSEVGGTFRFKGPDGKTLGTLSVVPKDSAGKNAGVLLMINFKGTAAGAAVSAAGGLR
jgi:hypothetical protein